MHLFCYGLRFDLIVTVDLNDWFKDPCCWVYDGDYLSEPIFLFYHINFLILIIKGIYS